MAKPLKTREARAAAEEPLSSEELQKLHAYWRASNYLAAGMIYLRANPLLREPLKAEHVKRRLLGHWGASPGLSFTYIHLNRLINKYELDAIFMAGPGHGAPGVLAPAYLEGGYSEIYPNKAEDEAGMLEFFREFSFPAESAVTARPRRRARSTRGASSAIACHTRSARRSTIRICSWQSWSGMARPRRGRSPRRGIRTSF